MKVSEWWFKQSSGRKLMWLGLVLGVLFMIAFMASLGCNSEPPSGTLTPTPTELPDVDPTPEPTPEPPPPTRTYEAGG